MRKFLRSFIVLLSLSLFVACGGGGGAVGKALAHQKAMLKIVEANKTDAAKAATELEAYIKSNEADLTAVKADMEKLKAEAKDDMGKAMSIMKDNAEAIQEVQELKKKLRDEAKDVMNDEKVAELLRTVRGI